MNNIDHLTAWQWWASQRRRYNIGLIVAGLAAFVCYVTVVFTFEERIPNAEITVFTTLFQGIGYLIMIGLANVCFFLGPIAEKTIRPKDVNRFRTITFGLGYWGSVALPFIIPVLLLIEVFVQPSWWTGP